MPAPLVGAALLAAKLAAKQLAKNQAKKSLAKAGAASAKTAAKIEKRAMRGINSPTPKSNKPISKITKVKPSGIKNPVLPQAGKYTGGRAQFKAEVSSRQKDTIKKLTKNDSLFGGEKKIDGVKSIYPKRKYR
jgi:hypothetical protein